MPAKRPRGRLSALPGACLATRSRCVTLGTTMATISNAHIGIAGVHHVVSELSRRGLVALPTVRNLAAYDILVANVEGTWHANVQVKSSSKAVGGFPMPAADKVRTGKRDFYVLARWVEKPGQDGRYECFLLTGRQAKAEIERTNAIKQRAIDARTRKVLIPGVEVGKANARAAARWHRAWLKWRA